VGFSSRKSDISLYGLLAAPSHAEMLPKLGRHKAGKGCLYIKSLSGIDLKVLEKLIVEAATSKKHEHG
jgi:hypothetical protein